jgi:probable HAF family extracellular repeat protein
MFRATPPRLPHARWSALVLASLALSTNPAAAVDTFEFTPYVGFLTPDGLTVGGFIEEGIGVVHPFILRDGVVTVMSQYGETTALSSDGSTLVGMGLGSSTGADSFKWDGTTVTPLERLPGSDRALAWAVSSDGSVVVGASSYNTGPFTATLWGADNVAVDLGYLEDGVTSAANAVSADGTVVAGASNLTADWHSVQHAFRWTGGVMTDIHTLDPDNQSGATMISSDGSVLVGDYYAADFSFNRAFRWTDGTGMVDLGTLGGTGSTAFAMSSDGSVLAGRADLADGTTVHAFRWTDADGMVDIDTLGSDASYAYDMTADGSIIVGAATDGAFRWTETGGMQLLSNYFADAGLDLSGIELTSAGIISDDGTTMIGEGTQNGEYAYWLSRCGDVECSFVNSEVVGASFADLGKMGTTGEAYVGNGLTTLGDLAGEAARTDATVDAFAYGAYDSDPTASSTVGLSIDLGTGMELGASVGVAAIRTDMVYDGHSDFLGSAASLFLAGRPESGPQWLLGASGMLLDGDITRGYLNGATPVTSSGSTTGTGYGAIAQIGYAFTFGETSFTPYASSQWTSASYAGWTETDGPLPATFGDIDSHTTLIRVGVDLTQGFGNGATATLGVAATHRKGDRGTISGDLPGLIDISVAGDLPAADAVELSAGLTLPVGDQLKVSGKLTGIIPTEGNTTYLARLAATYAF